MKKSLIFSVLVVFIVSMIFAGVGCKTETTETAEAEEAVTETAEEEKTEEETAETAKTYNIAVVPKDASNPWFVHMEEGVIRFAEETGHNAYMKGPSEHDPVQEVQVVEDLISQDIDALLVVPIDPSSMEVVLKKALDKGIVVLTHEASNQENTMYDIEAFDNEAYGEFIMDNLAEAMDYEGVYTTMVAFLTSTTHREWADAGVARQLEKYPDMQLLEECPRVETGSTAEGAYEAAKELLKKYPQLKGITGASSYDAPGAARAIDELGLKGKVFTVGTGMPQENAEILKNGSVSSLALWDAAETAYAMCNLAVKILEGEEIEDGVDLGTEGYHSMRLVDNVLYGEAFILITKDNVDSFGF